MTTLQHISPSKMESRPSPHLFDLPHDIFVQIQQVILSTCTFSEWVQLGLVSKAWRQWTNEAFGDWLEGRGSCNGVNAIFPGTREELQFVKDHVKDLTQRSVSVRYSINSSEKKWWFSSQKVHLPAAGVKYESLEYVPGTGLQLQWRPSYKDSASEIVVGTHLDPEHFKVIVQRMLPEFRSPTKETCSGRIWKNSKDASDALCRGAFRNVPGCACFVGPEIPCSRCAVESRQDWYVKSWGWGFVMQRWELEQYELWV
ncbi:unnamed protein product [Periconia digitata]|uniref:F-box domain-containing protein n=1 Tax=Periconia digitata TaxID=1303443 RepID=A0A9W4UWY1_9PLEO|nr:unnamed protein product [Periconia digitata]